MQRILIYGTSIFLAGLVAQINHLAHIEICQRHTLINLGDLASFSAVVVDMNDPHASDMLTLLRARPNLPVIGVNDASGAITVLTGQVYLAQSMEDILSHLPFTDTHSEENKV